jgi:hypothetical protein
VAVDGMLAEDETMVAQADTEVTERWKKSAKGAQRRWPKN